MKSFTFIDLFAGVGGMRLPFEKAGGKCLFTSEIDPKACETYSLNFETCIPNDITKIDIDKEIPKFNVLLAGFPCQPFSIAGYQKGFRDKGRGDLFFYIIEIINKKSPDVIFLENVKNLKTHDKGKTFEIITNELTKSGYHIKTKVMNSIEYGNIPQNRERVYIVGFKDINKFNSFEFPKKIKLKDNFRNRLETDINIKYYYNGKPLYDRIKKDITSYKKVYQWRRKYVRENKKGVVPTLTANMGSGGHNVPIIRDKKGIRKLTPRETFLMQGFPKKFKLPNQSDNHLYHQSGNSVVVPVIRRIVKKIIKVL